MSWRLVTTRPSEPTSSSQGLKPSARSAEVHHVRRETTAVALPGGEQSPELIGELWNS